ncbi:hypothetical protein VZ94_03660 [Methylocucumis oryzae]|uniref:Endonuclease/exonuclease/phosphatase domain-containing protein n=2 Tax=Methylocucumis oryzae TaxID=1632867 RepID=A0A0F3ILJ1_9GAMM|nr:hypothetical protein VZ94_03660 [Methylocucumis oryzae]
MVSAEGFHAVMDKQIALKQSRTVQGMDRKYFYNPMWSRLGDDSIGSPGTYFHKSPTMIDPFWHTLDQVLLRPSLLASFKSDALVVIDQIADKSLVERGKPASQFSDHLPLMIKLDMSLLLGGH